MKYIIGIVSCFALSVFIYIGLISYALDSHYDPEWVDWVGYVFPNAEPSDERIWTEADIVARQKFESLKDCASWGEAYGSYYYECDAYFFGKERGWFFFQPQVAEDGTIVPPGFYEGTDRDLTPPTLRERLESGEVKLPI